MVGLNEFDLRGAQSDYVSNFVARGEVLVKADVGKAMTYKADVIGAISTALIGVASNGDAIAGKLVTINPIKNDFNSGKNEAELDESNGKYDDCTIQNKGFVEFDIDPAASVPLVIGEGVVGGNSVDGTVNGSGAAGVNNIVHKINTTTNKAVVELK